MNPPSSSDVLGTYCDLWRVRIQVIPDIAGALAASRARQNRQAVRACCVADGTGPESDALPQCTVFGDAIERFSPGRWTVRRTQPPGPTIGRETDLASTLVDVMAETIREMMSQVEGDQRRLDPTFEITFDPADERVAFAVLVSPMEPSLRLLFDDSSFYELEDAHDGELPPEDRRPLDEGVALLEPITQHEYAGIERLLSGLDPPTR